MQSVDNETNKQCSTMLVGIIRDKVDYFSIFFAFDKLKASKSNCNSFVKGTTINKNATLKWNVLLCYWLSLIDNL